MYLHFSYDVYSTYKRNPIEVQPLGFFYYIDDCITIVQSGKVTFKIVIIAS